MTLVHNMMTMHVTSTKQEAVFLFQRYPMWTHKEQWWNSSFLSVRVSVGLLKKSWMNFHKIFWIAQAIVLCFYSYLSEWVVGFNLPLDE